MDHFKVVYIKELNEIEPVPHRWEEKGRLWYPRKLKELHLQQDPSNIPNKETWKHYKCIVKAQGISAWEHASQTANQLCETTSEEEDPKEREKKRPINKPSKLYDATTSDEEDPKECEKKRPIKKPLKLYDDYLEGPSYHFSKKKSVDTATKNTHPLELVVLPEIHQESLSSDITCNITNLVTNDTSNDNEKQQDREQDINNDTLIAEPVSLLATEQDIKQVLKVLQSNKQFAENCFEKLMYTLKDVQLQIGHLEAVIKENQPQLIEAQIEQPPTEMNFPLVDVDNMNRFENKLQGKDYQKKVIIHLRKIVGTGYQWRTASYKLVNVMFTKKVLTMYSWTGVTRSNSNKLPFNKLVNILDVIYHVVKFADSNFSYAEREKFFRDAVLKHSMSRLNPKKKNTAGTNHYDGKQGNEEASNQEPETEGEQNTEANHGSVQNNSDEEADITNLLDI